MANHTEWTVRNGVIRIYLVEEDSYVEIANYSLDDNYFDGSIFYGNTVVDFQMNHVSSPNWNNYYYGYDYWIGYYAKPADATRSVNDGDRPVRIFGNGK